MREVIFRRFPSRNKKDGAKPAPAAAGVRAPASGVHQPCGRTTNHRFDQEYPNSCPHRLEIIRALGDKSSTSLAGIESPYLHITLSVSFGVHAGEIKGVPSKRSAEDERLQRSRLG